MQKTGRIEGRLDEEVLAAAAHELKTPLAVISHLVSSLRDESLGLTDAQRQCYLQRIELTSERMVRLVEGLTQSYRLGQAGQELLALELEPLNVAQLCEEVAQELSPLATQLHQQLELRLPRKPGLVIGHRQLLQNVVTNLLDNALKHNPAETAVVLSCSNQLRMARLQVRDNGPAMTTTEFRQLQQRLGRQLQPTAYRAGSSGLGLYIAGQLARAMGGELGAVAHRRGGATFYVDLLRSHQLSFL